MILLPLHLYVTKNYSASYLKPFDVVKTYTTRFGFSFYHAGVYLGKIDEELKVCQFTGEKNDTTIGPWGDFVEGEVRGYHPVIPFKNYRDIAKQMVWAKDNHFRKGNYSLPNRNCEHFANMIVYGIDFSEQIKQNKEKVIALGSSATTYAIASGSFVAAGSALLAPVTFGLSLIPGAFGVTMSVVGGADTLENYSNINNGKISICLRDEIRETSTNKGLRKKSDYETEKYEKQYLIEVPPKQTCQVM